jgi:hypothetical protein
MLDSAACVSRSSNPETTLRRSLKVVGTTRQKVDAKPSSSSPEGGLTRTIRIRGRKSVGVSWALDYEAEAEKGKLMTAMEEGRTERG